ncbi:MAG: cupin domain-containing protein [Vicinamibacterales bacterium]
MRTRVIAGTAAVLGLSVVFGPLYREPARAQTPQSGGSLTLIAPGDIKWEATARPDTRRASLWGDSSKGPFAHFSRYDSGWRLPLHFHTNDLRGLILSGTFIIHVAGQPTKELPTGSYFSVPGKTRHTDACKAGPPCVVYFTGDAPLDRINVDTP